MISPSIIRLLNLMHLGQPKLALRILGWSICIIGLTLALPSVAKADSPPNLTTDIPWTDTGGVYDPNAGIFDATFSGVADIEAAFNNGRRQEETQLGLPANSLGTLNLPGQSVWDGLTDNERALTILNAERIARAGNPPGVIGLPFQNWDAATTQLAQDYADLLISVNGFGHNLPSNNPAVDSPFLRIQNDPVLGPCTEFLSRAENIAGFWTSGTVNPLPIERAIYNWSYADAGSSWGHREAALLQDTDLTNNNPLYGFNNNVGGAASEGFIGFGIANDPSYDPFSFGFSNMGTVVIMVVIDPISTGSCPWDSVPPTSTPTDVPPTSTPTAIPPTSTPTDVPPTSTPTAIPPTSTPTDVPPTSTPTAIPPTSTPTDVPPTSTPTAIPPTSTPTDVPPTSTPTAIPPTSTPTDVPPTSTPTAIPPTSTPTDVPPTSTPTDVPPTSTPTAIPPTSTPTDVPPTSTPTAIPPTSTPTDVPPTSTPTDVPPTSTSTPGGPTNTTVYLSTTYGGNVSGISYRDEDILAFDTETQTWSLFFDGSDLGLTSRRADVDAFTILSDGSLLFSLRGDTYVRGFGWVDDSDITQFIPSSLGGFTQGTLMRYFDGSDVGLSTFYEDVDAISAQPDGSLLISARGPFRVAGLSGRDEDIIRFVPSQLGATTAGTWSAYLDGSDVGLGSAFMEDIWGMHADGDAIYLTTLGYYDVPGLSGSPTDIFVCNATTIGAESACNYEPFWSAGNHGLAVALLDAVHVSTSAAGVSAASALSNLVAAADTDESVADEVDTDDLLQEENEDQIGDEFTDTLYLPFVGAD